MTDETTSNAPDILPIDEDGFVDLHALSQRIEATDIENEAMTIIASTNLLATLNALVKIQTAVLTGLQTAIALRQQARTDGLPSCTVPPTQHRREHRAGRPAKLDTDLELQAFVVARIDRLTYSEIAAEIATHFPKLRRVGKSAIHSWWNRPDVKRTFAG
jgi:hypothetical protein